MRMDRGRRRPLVLAVTAAVTAGAVVVVAGQVDTGSLASTARAVVASPLPLVAAVAVYAGAFVLRAWAWHRVVPSVPLGHGIAAIHVALLGNHLLPLRLGEPLRVTSVVRRARVDPQVAVASTVAMRGADLAALGALAAVLGFGVVADLSGLGAVALAVGAAAVVAAGAAWLVRLARAGRARVVMPGPAVVLAIVGAWAMEAGLLWVVARSAGVPLSVAEAVLVTTVTVAGQIAAIAPGGFGTYEAVGTAALFTLGIPTGTGLAIVLSVHAVKTAYALVAGSACLLVPAPSILGRFRLPRGRPARCPAPVPDGPVVLFLPAHNEQASVGDVVTAVPERVAGREVRCLVIDDGSVDATAEVAARAGADVVAMEANCGLGAAVRRGMSEALERGAAVVAFCDADGEYAPEELEAVVSLILDGEADYVVGSRFTGDIRWMRPHRRAGNMLLTAWTRWVAREPLTDGQSGYRALSREAAAEVTIAHDFNYAQVLTLDVLARGFRYAEVPIGYAFRRHGQSFVRPTGYLRRVVPAVWRVVNGVTHTVDRPASGG